VFLGIFHSLTQGLGILTGFTQAKADIAIMVANYYESSHAEASTAFDDLRDAGHLDYSFLQV